MKTLAEKLTLGEVVPYLNLPSHKNGSVNLWDLKQRKNSVIMFYHRTDCARCGEKLKELAKLHDKAAELDAEILAVSFDNLERLKRYAKSIGAQFHLLSDETGETTERFTYKDIERRTPFPSVFITDRFGVLRYQKIASESDEFPDGEEILSWLLLIQTECPECSHL